MSMCVSQGQTSSTMPTFESAADVPDPDSELRVRRAAAVHPLDERQLERTIRLIVEMLPHTRIWSLRFGRVILAHVDECEGIRHE